MFDPTNNAKIMQAKERCGEGQTIAGDAVKSVLEHFLAVDRADPGQYSSMETLGNALNEIVTCVHEVKQILGYETTPTTQVSQESMTRQRMGEIAIAMLKYQLGQDGLKLNASFQRRLGHAAKAAAIHPTELTEFAARLIEELVCEHVKPPRKMAPSKK